MGNRDFKKHQKPVCFVNKKGVIKEAVWENNPHITSIPTSENKISLQFNKVPERFTKQKWNVSRHTIVSRCKHFGYDNPEIHTHMFFNNNEQAKIKKLRENLPKHFVVVEPHAKISWCAQKQYPLHKWQKIVDTISKEYTVIQMSHPENASLNNVVNISNEINNFREAACFLQYATLFMSTEGGLMHACNATHTPCLIIFSPLFDPLFTKYDNVTDIWVKTNSHKNCFREGDCATCRKIMSEHDEEIVIEKALESMATLTQS